MKVTTYGIDNATPVAQFVGELVTAIASMDANQDGQISWLEILNKVQVIGFKAISTFTNTDLTMLKKELADLDNEELKQLIEAFADKFKLSKQEAEWLIEDWLRHIADTAKLVGRTVAAVKN